MSRKRLPPEQTPGPRREAPVALARGLESLILGFSPKGILGFP